MQFVPLHTKTVGYKTEAVHFILLGKAQCLQLVTNKRYKGYKWVQMYLLYAWARVGQARVQMVHTPLGVYLLYLCTSGLKMSENGGFLSEKI